MTQQEIHILREVVKNEGKVARKGHPTTHLFEAIE